MTKEDVRTCVLAGYDVRTMNGFDVYELYGKICGDKVLSDKAMIYLGTDEYPAVLPMDSRDKVLASMSKAELAALRARIAGR
jgi:hypothetical protein